MGVVLDTFSSQFRVNVRDGSRVRVVRITEQLMDDLLESGSRHAETALDRLLAANLWFASEVRAS